MRYARVVGDTGKVRALDREEDAPASRSFASGSVGQVAAELAGASLRDLGLADLSPAAIHQLAGVLDRLDAAERRGTEQRRTVSRDPQQTLDAAGPVVMRLLAVIIGLVVVMMLVMGVLAGLRVADKLESADTLQTQRMGALEVRVAEAEAKRLQHQAELDQTRKDADALAEDLAEDLALVKARQSALVLHLLDAVSKLADAEGVKLPDPAPVLRIAQAEAKLGQ